VDFKLFLRARVCVRARVRARACVWGGAAASACVRAIIVIHRNVQKAEKLGTVMAVS